MVLKGVRSFRVKEHKHWGGSSGVRSTSFLHLSAAQDGPPHRYYHWKEQGFFLSVVVPEIVPVAV